MGVWMCVYAVKRVCNYRYQCLRAVLWQIGKERQVILIDASKLGEEYKEGNNQKRRLRDFEIDKIVNTFQNKEAVDDFSVAVTYDEIKEKGYSLSAGQYFDIKIDYVDITEEEFNKRMDEYKTTLKAQFEESHRLEEEILKQLDSISFNENVGKEHDDE